MLYVLLAVLGVNLFFSIRNNRAIAAVKQTVDDIRKIVEPERAVTLGLTSGPVSEQK